jgi:hypothetical protein
MDVIFLDADENVSKTHALTSPRFGLPMPIYVNMVRDPVERVISWYYYVRAPWYFVERKRAFPDLPLPNPNWLRKVHTFPGLFYKLNLLYQASELQFPSKNKLHLGIIQRIANPFLTDIYLQQNEQVRGTLDWLFIRLLA